MADKLVSEQVNIVWVKNSTPGWLAMASTTRSTSTTEAMFIPQWQTNTPIRGSSSVTSCSLGYFFLVISECRADAKSSIDIEAAALACVTVSGMSLGSWKAPPTKTPSREVARGDRRFVEQNWNSLRTTPIVAAERTIDAEGSIPTESTTRSKSCSVSWPSSPIYRRRRSWEPGI
jgi:hypothetical protein